MKGDDRFEYICTVRGHTLLLFHHVMDYVIHCFSLLRLGVRMRLILLSSMVLLVVVPLVMGLLEDIHCMYVVVMGASRGKVTKGARRLVNEIKEGDKGRRMASGL